MPTTTGSNHPGSSSKMRRTRSRSSTSCWQRSSGDVLCAGTSSRSALQLQNAYIF
ncbi:hypothetical protein ANCCAN_13731 [Ancylostoma caninum]|uniref:Uncharacterized protein n=1 Tax=Ancylostoma caninum TaxID=29170 RepID=A0A368GBG6_ANCCA|nr:hypothetical protein ANCCAN_13731 [Ancylostoma caninum]